jgi:hypothetical protein
MGSDISRRTRQQRRQTGGDFEGAGDPLAPTRGRRGPILTEEGEVIGLDPTRPRRTGGGLDTGGGLLSTRARAGAIGGVAAATTVSARRRLEAAQQPGVTETEVVRGRPEARRLPGQSMTGVGALALTGTATESLSDFEGNLTTGAVRTADAEAIGASEIAETAPITDSEVVTEPVEESRTRGRTDARSETRMETRLDTRQEMRSETRTDVRPRAEVQTEVVGERRQEPPSERRIEPRAEFGVEPRSEATLFGDRPLLGPAEPDMSTPDPGVGMDETPLAPGWLTETVFTFATSGTETPRAPSQSVLEAQPTSLMQTGELPVAQALGDDETAAAFAETQAFLDPSVDFGDANGDRGEEDEDLFAFRGFGGGGFL